MTAETTAWLNDRYFELLDLQARFQHLYRPELKTWPVPFFGNLLEAEVLTVGVNPSCAEFDHGRWEQVRNPAEAQERLLHYFSLTGGQHPWFDAWERGLNHISASYYASDGQAHLAAHIDLSAQPTRPMSQLPEEPFIEMVKQELPWFIDFLSHAQQAKLLIMAGCVTKYYYLNEFLSEFLPADSAELHGGFNRRTQAGAGKIAFQRLDIKGRQLPVFFCSSSPSDRSRGKNLVDRMRAFATPIRRHGRLRSEGETPGPESSPGTAG